MCNRKKKGGIVFNKLKTIEFELLKKLSARKTRHEGEIYHYTSPNGLKGIVEDAAIWFSDMRFLNDSSELTYIYKLAFKVVTENPIYTDLQDIIRNICNYIYTSGCYSVNNEEIIPLDTFYLASFSKDPDNLNLWNYYTKSQNSLGYNICIDTNNSLILNSNQEIIYGEVIYKTSEQEELLKKCFEKYISFINQNQNNYTKYEGLIQESIVRTLEIYNLFFKPEAYEAEKEYRFVIWNYNGQENIKYRINNGVFIPYIPVKLKKDAIKSICISPSKEQDLAKTGLESFILQSNRFMTADIKKSAIPKRY